MICCARQHCAIWTAEDNGQPAGHERDSLPSCLVMDNSPSALCHFSAFPQHHIIVPGIAMGKDLGRMPFNVPSLQEVTRMRRVSSFISGCIPVSYHHRVWHMQVILGIAHQLEEASRSCAKRSTTMRCISSLSVWRDLFIHLQALLFVWSMCGV